VNRSFQEFSLSIPAEQSSLYLENRFDRDENIKKTVLKLVDLLIMKHVVPEK
jgi:hypothetical protein